MEAEISQLVSRYDGGSLSRRELIQGLAILSAAAAGTAENAHCCDSIPSQQLRPCLTPGKKS